MTGVDLAFALGILGACATGFIADRRGRNGAWWFLAGTIGWVVALPLLLLLPKHPEN
jgi:hypothetical protein